MSEQQYICETCGEGFDSGGRLGVHVVRVHSDSKLGSPISEEELIQSIQELGDELGEPPTAKKMAELGEYSHKVCSNRFGSWNDALRAAGYEPQKRDNIPKSQLLEEIERLTEKFGRPPSSVEMCKEGRFSRYVFLNRFGSWEEALNRAGYRRPDSFQESHGVFPYGSNWSDQREEALARDEYECQIPTCRMSREEHLKRHNSDLHVHHITPRRYFVGDDGELNEGEANRLDNLITLCAPHHHYWEPITPLRPDTRP
jgi:5-methylcytosine-specific restriction endonuclease McrA